ncbi:hypothetical protein EV356DRAFT_293213 [Viridothelium virens]|uniref:Uncharacterized protein n=1 Tax=Viridothelium virens TaxID=1048519 RepID=A0A6A6H0L6_VIRVR|nr:hypothetical protein EV356DRAFT_293213 [Viridothelium virens]
MPVPLSAVSPYYGGEITRKSCRIITFARHLRTSYRVFQLCCRIWPPALLMHTERHHLDGSVALSLRSRRITHYKTLEPCMPAHPKDGAAPEIADTALVPCAKLPVPLVLQKSRWRGFVKHGDCIETLSYSTRRKVSGQPPAISHAGERILFLFGRLYHCLIHTVVVRILQLSECSFSPR